MEYLEIKHTNIPVLGLGTCYIPNEVTADITARALHLGYRHIDAAQWYNNEQEVGTGIRNSGVPRSELFLTTKVQRRNLGKQEFLPSVEESLRRLQTDYVDLLLVHWPHAELPLESYLEELMKAMEQGKTRFVGVSNFNIAQLKRTMELGVPIITNQVEFHPLLDQSKLYGWMRRQQLSLTAYCPLAQGKAVRDPVLTAIGEKYGKSAAQASLRWLVQQEGVMAIPKTANPGRLLENLEVFDFELTDEDMAAIAELKHCNVRIVPAYHGAVWDDKAAVAMK
ncbi:MAG: aldo/keto reductase [Phaeodactylibacter sp.]|nr:aldo/keto reductase [Phaeodactylibacter sp.]